MTEAQKNVTSMTRDDFAKVPRYIDNFDLFDPNKESFESLVIIPTGNMHDSGYQCMEFALINGDGEAICRINGIADVIHIDGIGGYGVGSISRAMRLNDVTPVTIPHGWCIDCLPCGYLRLFASSGFKLILERPYMSLSSFEIYAEERKEK